MKQWWRYITLIFVLMLSACSSLDTPKLEGTGVASDTMKLQRTGRFAVLVYDKTEEKNIDSVQGNFDWTSWGNHVLLDLRSPLGQVLARIEVQPRFSQLIRANGDIFEAESPDALIQRVIGRVFPVSGLQYWVYGRPMPGIVVDNAEYDEQHRLIKFTQAGWAIMVQNYDQWGPKRFQLTHRQVTERITVRIVME